MSEAQQIRKQTTSRTARHSARHQALSKSQSRPTEEQPARRQPSKDLSTEAPGRAPGKRRATTAEDNLLENQQSAAEEAVSQTQGDPREGRGQNSNSSDQRHAQIQEQAPSPLFISQRATDWKQEADCLTLPNKSHSYGPMDHLQPRFQISGRHEAVSPSNQQQFRPSGYNGPQPQGTREKKGCSCKNSQCLKLYCECLSRGEYCGPHCHCSNCKNNSDNEHIRAETITNILERKPDAFRAKITSSQVKPPAYQQQLALNKMQTAPGQNLPPTVRAPKVDPYTNFMSQPYPTQARPDSFSLAPQQSQDVPVGQPLVEQRAPNMRSPSGKGDLTSEGGQRHAKGCNCKKSKCLKKYCECFQAGIVCNQYCKCVGCKNYQGCQERNQIIEHLKQIAQQNEEQQSMFRHPKPDYMEASQASRYGGRWMLPETLMARPLNVKREQEKCANTFGFDFDIKFCTMPSAIESPRGDQKQVQSTNQPISNGRLSSSRQNFEPSLDTCLGLSKFSEQFRSAEKPVKKRLIGQRTYCPSKLSASVQQLVEQFQTNGKKRQSKPKNLGGHVSDLVLALRKLKEEDNGSRKRIRA